VSTTSKGTLIYGSLLTVLVGGSLVVSIWSAMLLSSGHMEARPTTVHARYPAGSAQIEAEFYRQPNETRPAFINNAADAFELLTTRIPPARPKD